MKYLPIIIIAVIISLLLVTGCKSPVKPDLNITTSFQMKTIKTDGNFAHDECVRRGLEDKVLMLESKYCGHCQETLPIFKQVAAEKGFKPTILDITEKEQAEEMNSYGIKIKYTPTFIFGCEYFVGEKTADEYGNLFDDFLRTIQQ